MNRKKIFSTLCLSLFLLPAAIFAGERTIPVDFFIMIDKSLSMAEPGKFESMHEWVRSQLIGQMLIPGDWVTIYQFYGTTEHVLTLELKDDADRAKIISTIDSIKADGGYTDIGVALDTIQLSLAERKDSQKIKILYMLTDLKQEAPWSSRYAGIMEQYTSTFLAEARMLKHDNWYEITLDMDIQGKVISTTKELYTAIAGANPADRDSRLTNPASTGEAGSGSTIIAVSGSDGTNSGQVNSSGGATDTKDSAENGVPLPFLAGIVVASIGALAWFGIVVFRARKRRDDPEETAKKKH